MPGSSNISGDESIIFCDNMSFDGTERGGKMTTNGQLWIGSTASPHVRLGSLTSTGGTIDITTGNGTINLEQTSVGDLQELSGNSGTATPTGGIINVVTANATVKFAGVAGILKQDFGIPNVVLGSSLSSVTSGTSNSGVGIGVLRDITSGNSNTALGNAALRETTTGIGNVAIGSTALTQTLSANGNTAVGANSMNLFTGTGTTANTCLGSGTHASGTGSNNTVIGYNAGVTLSGTDSSNIIIGNAGTSGDNNKIRIGTQGSGAGQQTDCHLAGILHTTSGRTVNVTVPGAYPYTALTTDYVILVDTSSARTINLMATPTTGTVLVIKDNVGSANSNNITITPAAGNIDGSASATINIAYGSVTLVRNSAQWNII